MRKFMAHQKKAFQYAKPLSRIALFMEMRLGKSMVAIRWAEFNKAKRILVVAPLSVLPSWEEELLKEENAYEDICYLRGEKDERYQLAKTSKAPWNLINYEALLEENPSYNPNLQRGRNSKKRVGGEILKLPWDCLIVDESTRIRNPKAETSYHLTHDSDHVSLKAILSGLPAPESSLDYYQQFKFLYGSFMHFHDYWTFRNRRFMCIGYDWVPSKFVRGKIKEEVHRLSFVLTRKQAGVGSKKVYEKRYVDMTPAQVKLYKEIKKGFSYKLEEEEKETKWVPVKYLWMGQIAGGLTPEGKLVSNNKTNELIELLKGELKNESVVVWFRYNQEIRHVYEQLTKKKIKTGIFTGEDKSGSDMFKKRNVQVLLAQARCGQYGIDWSIASTAIYYSNYYDCEVRYQSEDRIVHPKKKEPLLYIDLICKDSIDESVMKILREKRVSARQFSMKLVKDWSAKCKSVS